LGAGDLLPVVAAVGALVQRRPRTAAFQAVRRTADAPGAGVEDARVVGVEDQVHGAGVAVGEQDALPRLAAVRAAEDAALVAGAVQAAQDGGVHHIGVPGVDANARDVVGVGQADVLPGLAGVERLPHTVAVRDVAADRLLAAADVEHVGIGLAD